MLYRVTILFVLMIFCVGSLPLITHGQRGSEPAAQQSRRVTLFTKHVDHPDGRTVDSFSGRHQKGDKTINLSSFTVKKGAKRRRDAPTSQSQSSNALFSKASMTNSPLTYLVKPQNPAPVEGGYDPGYEYYYAYSGMTRPDGSVMAEAAYEYDSSASQNTLSITLGGVTLNCDLATEEAAPLSDAEQAQLEAWGTSDDANMVRDASLVIIDEGPQQTPSQLLLNYYAIALFVDTIPATASGPRLDSPRKNSLHHAVSSFSAPANAVSAPCPERMITPVAAVATSLKSTTNSMIIGNVMPQCFGCCGLGCHCITDRYGAPIYGTPCANHDACVGQPGYNHFSPSCGVKLAKAVVYTWWRNSAIGARIYYLR